MESYSPPSLSLRKKLEYLMVIRVLMVTLLLGSAIIVNINDVDSFADPSYLAIATLIIATYAATIIYALLVPRLKALEVLTYVQLTGDVLLAAGLIVLTGSSTSIFSFLLYLTIINSAIVMGQSGAFFTATQCGLVLLGILLYELDFIGLPGGHLALPDRIPGAVVYNPMVHIFACYLVCFLAGHLANRLEEQGSELERHRLDIVELQALTLNILSSISEGVLTLNNKQRVLFLNQGGETLFGQSADEIYGLKIEQCLPELKSALDALLFSNSGVRARGQFDQWSGWITRTVDSSPLFLSVSHSQLYSLKGEPYGHIFILKDQTQVNAMEQHMRRQDRLAAVGQLAAGIAHEIRNPLASISGSIEMLQMVLEVDEDEQRLMSIVIREVERLNHLIESFLNYSRPARKAFEPIRLSDLIGETVELFERDVEMNKGLVLKVEGQNPQITVNGDGEALRQVFWNLLRNAAQAIEGEGEIVLRLSLFKGVQLQDRSWNAVNKGGELVLNIEISDTGVGIPAEQHQQIFEPFFTTKAQGTGLGLATINRIIEDHNGFISVESVVGEGSTFSVKLPSLKREKGASEEGEKSSLLERWLGSGKERETKSTPAGLTAPE